jgi:CRP-like cAMP-binding protein
VIVLACEGSRFSVVTVTRAGTRIDSSQVDDVVTKQTGSIAVTQGALAAAADLTPGFAGTCELTRMLACIPGTRITKVAKTREIVIAGKPYQWFYANRDGWLFRYKILHNGGRQIVDFVLPGDIFAVQACLFKGSLYSIATITPASLSLIPFGSIDQVFELNPRLSKALFWSAACEAARLAEHLTDAGRRSAYERLSHLILELFVRLKIVGLVDGMSFRMPLTQELIADALGLTPIHINRTIRSLREDKLIAVEGKRVIILDFEALSLLSDFETSYLGESARAMKAQL